MILFLKKLVGAAHGGFFVPLYLFYQPYFARLSESVALLDWLAFFL